MAIDWFSIIKGFYDDGLWSKKRVHDVVAAGRITPEQYEEITGDKYEADKPPAEES
ncbi:XkdX family protein [Bacillus cereus]